MDQIAKFDEPLVGLDDAAWAAKVTGQRLQNWLHRRVLILGTPGAGSGRKRQLSPSDALQIIALAELVHLGQKPSIFEDKALVRAVKELGKNFYEALATGNENALATLATMRILRLRYDWLQRKVLWSFVENPAPPDAFTSAPYLALDLHSLVVRLVYYVCRVRGLDLPAIVREEAEKFNASLPVGPGLPLEFTG